MKAVAPILIKSWNLNATNPAAIAPITATAIAPGMLLDTCPKRMKQAIPPAAAPIIGTAALLVNWYIRTATQIPIEALMIRNKKILPPEGWLKNKVEESVNRIPVMIRALRTAIRTNINLAPAYASKSPRTIRMAPMNGATFLKAYLKLNAIGQASFPVYLTVNVQSSTRVDQLSASTS